MNQFYVLKYFFLHYKMLKCDYAVTPFLLYGESKPKVILMIGSLYIYCDLSVPLLQ